MLVDSSDMPPTFKSPGRLRRTSGQVSNCGAWPLSSVDMVEDEACTFGAGIELKPAEEAKFYAPSMQHVIIIIFGVKRVHILVHISPYKMMSNINAMKMLAHSF